MTRYTNILSPFFFLFLLLGTGSILSAQEGQNPFEIPGRTTNSTEDLTEEEPPNVFDLQENNEETKEEDFQNPNPQNTLASPEAGQKPFELETEKIVPATNLDKPQELKENPFEIDHLPVTNPLVKESAPSPVLQPQTTSAATNNRNFLFWTSTFILVFFTLLITLYKPVVGQIYKSFLNDNILKLKQREQGVFLNLSLALLYLSFFLNAGFFIYLMIQEFEWSGDQHLKTLLYSILGVAGIFILKHIVLRILGNIFPINKELRQYSFTIVVFNIILGIILLPFNLLIAFGPSFIPKYLIFTLLAIALVIYGFRLIRSLIIAGRHISLHKFHFFMYLCTVEIAPTLVLVKLLLLLQG